MSLLRLSNKHKEIALMLLSNTKVPDIAKKFNMHPKSVYRILNDPLVQEYEGKLFNHMAYRCIEKQLEDIASHRGQIRREKRRLLSKHYS